jgi:hypothetical protein
LYHASSIAPHVAHDLYNVDEALVVYLLHADVDGYEAACAANAGAAMHQRDARVGARIIA